MPNVFSMLYSRMNWLNTQMSTSAENLENANVPGWDRRVLEPLSFQDNLKSSAAMPRATHENHLHGTLTKEGGIQVKADKHRVTTLNGNSVSIEQEMDTINKATIDHAEMTKLYKKFTEILRMPLRS